MSRQHGRPICTHLDRSGDTAMIIKIGKFLGVYVAVWLCVTIPIAIAVLVMYQIGVFN